MKLFLLYKRDDDYGAMKFAKITIIITVIVELLIYLQ